MNNIKPKTYAEAGVDISKGDRFAEFIKNAGSRFVSKNLGGFAGGIEIDIKKYKKPVLLSTTDGVGTKLLVAKRLNRFDTIGIDLVAMCVNDLIACGAVPEIFLDYIACGKIDENILKPVIKGIIKGCELSSCVLAGGETAEMPDLYNRDDFDLAGFSVGIVEKEKMLPRLKDIENGDILLGLASSGLHSNGFSLARKIIPDDDDDILSEILKPTKIYVKEMLTLLRSDLILAAAHITGGGLESNIRRIIPKRLNPVLSEARIIPDIFKTIQNYGNISKKEMYKVFNMGIGMCIIVKKNKENSILEYAESENILLQTIGCIR